jgi:dTDP-4-dehydrorhamnose reductase
MSVVVTGAGGLLGGAVVEAFAKAGATVHGLSRADLDITDAGAVEKVFAQLEPTLVVHPAAMTNVDACELEPDKAWAVNAEGSHNVAHAAALVGAEIVAISTDYVFDGTKGSYTESDETNPIQVYGSSKLGGEHSVREANERHYIVRSAWIYGLGGKNFLSKLPGMVGAESINAVIDQNGSPTFASDLAEALITLVGTKSYGLYHVVNSDTCSFADFCRFALEILGSQARIDEVHVADLGRPAPRPLETSLVAAAGARAGLEPLRSWRDAARSFLGSAVSA